MSQTIKKIEVHNNYSKIFDPVMMAIEVVNTEAGVVQTLNLTDKVVYSYISHHAEWFNSIGKCMFESQDSIGFSLGIDRKTVGRSLKKLESVGLIVRSKQKANNGFMTVYDVPMLFCSRFRLFAEKTVRVRGQEDFVEKVEIVLKEVDKPGSTKYTTPQSVKQVAKNIWIEEDDPECPF